ncbi:MAG: 50S ribosomal protein L1 [Spiroplasma poulsonii]|uniref:Large ribosomal subunit protein uL1 n=2 Tax=Spiroplasma poulsonii TaxID=2138 RepID=A0A2P6FGB4_9MOLU|nr:50S ribosomal protein L1 [Spiroplasma poulsonii]KAF0849794.1 50S ribosomal protein L1 [Spiroplasma poulsonii]MBW1242529.1 50S ribosomal protein L1 [Spiroplasma poulsonii]PQM32501.1 50S ribosomal protein L1 [Spiroplasma poulsonii]PWF95169.1 50S ribosomal protein L1 [Spiroplasma poulsonii]PWF97960.1 50S ribosomal protein L1 [Spiroplasma poulsonii]
MAKFGKKYNQAVELVEKNKVYPITEAIELAKKTATTKFDSTVEVAFNLNVDPRHADQQIRGAVVLPKGTGKTQRILVLTNSKEADAKAAGANFVGGKDLIEKIQKENWFDYDVIIATPDIMAELGKIGKLLGPKGLMPNPKTGTVTPDVTKAIDDVKKGKVEYRVDKNGNIHSIIGKASFKAEDLKANYDVIYETIRKAKPAAVKGAYIKNIAVTTTMGPGIKVLIEL